MVEENEQLEAGDSKSDASADTKAKTDGNEEVYVGLTTKSLVQTTDKKQSLTSEQKTQENINKRIGKLVGQKHGLENENQALRERLAVVESKVDVKSSDKGEKNYSTPELETAFKKAHEDNNVDLMFEIQTQLAKNEAAILFAKKDEATATTTAAADREKAVHKAVLDDFPDMGDNKSQLYKTATDIWKALPELQQMGQEGHYRAAAKAVQMIYEAGGGISDAQLNKTNKKQMKESLGGGDVSGESDDEGQVSDSQSMDNYFSSRKKYQQKLFDEIDEAATGKPKKG